jgi:hypothetical protein
MAGVAAGFKRLHPSATPFKAIALYRGLTNVPVGCSGIDQMNTNAGQQMSK